MADGPENLTLDTHLENNEWVTGFLVGGKSYEQVIEETVVDYLHHTAQPGKSVRHRQQKRSVYIAGSKSEVFTLSPEE